MRVGGEAAPAALWILSFLLVAAAARAMATSVKAEPVPVATVGRAPAVPALPDPPLLIAHADSLRQRNPFRLERVPTAQPFGAPAVTEAPPMQPQPDARPHLRVSGIIGGPPWKAVIEGIPGRESGLLLAVGEEWNGFRLAWVRRDSIRVVAPDTSWLLSLKQAWQ